MVWTLEKQRRSTVNWYALVPEEVARHQVVWERHMTVLAMHRAKLSFREIAELFGLSRGRVSQMHSKSARMEKYGGSPVERYYADMQSVRAIAVGVERRPYRAPVPAVRTEAAIAALTIPCKPRDWLFLR